MRVMIVTAEIKRASDGRRMTVKLPKPYTGQVVHVPGLKGKWTVVKVEHLIPNRK